MDRPDFLNRIYRLFKTHPIVALLGPRQCGKTTLARMYCKKQPSFPDSNYFDLERAGDIVRLHNPELSLSPLSGLIIIDEIQKRPDLFPSLRVLVDKENATQKYLILGSASKELIRQSSESLAGRVAYIELSPFSFGETHSLKKLWLRGGFPRAFLCKSEEDSFEWIEAYIRTFLEQDIPNLGIKIPPVALRRFWTMLAHYHGNIFNASEIGRSFGASDVTMRNYLDLLTGTFMIRELQPWYENLGKRQVKSPKVFFRDSGILHSLLNISSHSDLVVHPKLGVSWEGFALEQIIRAHKVNSEHCYFWATHGGAEVDLLIQKKGKLLGFECKYSDAPKMTKSMQVALNDLKLAELHIIYPGDLDYALSDKVKVYGIKNYLLQAF